MNNRAAGVIATCPLFRGIEPAKVKGLLESVKYSVRNYENGSLIMTRGDEYNDLMILIEGEISAEIQDFNGKTIKIENLKAPNAVATGILFAESNTLPVTLVAQTPIHLISLPREAVILMAQENREFLLNYFRDTGNKVVFLAEKIRLLQLKSLREQFTGYILSLSEKQNSDTVRLPYSREKLAELFGVARPSLSRVCSEMAKEGLIELKGKTVRLVDKTCLKEVL